jgi:hypothetical protein
MADKPHRQSWRMTRRELRKSLSRSGRKWLDGVWKATARTASEFEGLSPVTTVLGSRLVESYAAREHADSEGVQQALRVAVVYGYAARMVLLEPTEQPSLKPSAFQLNPQSDVGRLASDPAMPKRLLDPVRSIAGDRFDSVMTLPPAVWSALGATATQKLQRRFASDDKKLTWRELGRPRVEKMLKYGYVLRCLDETLDGEPTYREQDPDAETGAGAAAAPAATPSSGH